MIYEDKNIKFIPFSLCMLMIHCMNFHNNRIGDIQLIIINK